MWQRHWARQPRNPEPRLELGREVATAATLAPGDAGFRSRYPLFGIAELGGIGKKRNARPFGPGVGPQMLSAAGRVQNMQGQSTVSSSGTPNSPATATAPASVRVITYIDGFNLYFGLKTAGWKHYYWLNPRQIGLELLKPEQYLVKTRYFTARISADPADPDNAKRQSTYLDVVACEPDTSIVYGHYLAKPRRCFSCGASWQSYEEKKTDVNIAMALLNDASDDLFDVALVISADSDLVPPIESVRHRHPGKRVIVVFPPQRRSHDLARVATAAFPLGRKVIADSQFPDSYTTPAGIVLQRPARWAAAPEPKAGK